MDEHELPTSLTAPLPSICACLMHTPCACTRIETRCVLTDSGRLAVADFRSKKLLHNRFRFEAVKNVTATAAERTETAIAQRKWFCPFPKKSARCGMTKRRYDKIFPWAAWFHCHRGRSQARSSRAARVSHDMKIARWRS